MRDPNNLYNPSASNIGVSRYYVRDNRGRLVPNSVVSPTKYRMGQTSPYTPAHREIYDTVAQVPTASGGGSTSVDPPPLNMKWLPILVLIAFIIGKR